MLNILMIDFDCFLSITRPVTHFIEPSKAISMHDHPEDLEMFGQSHVDKKLCLFYKCA